MIDYREKPLYWDPTEPTATRPLAQADYSATTPSVYFYTHDLTKISAS